MSNIERWQMSSLQHFVHAEFNLACCRHCFFLLPQTGRQEFTRDGGLIWYCWLTIQTNWWGIIAVTHQVFVVYLTTYTIRDLFVSIALDQCQRLKCNNAPSCPTLTPDLDSWTVWHKTGNERRENHLKLVNELQIVKFAVINVASWQSSPKIRTKKKNLLVRNMVPPEWHPAVHSFLAVSIRHFHP